MATATLTYKGVATKNVQHTTGGVIYLHHFGTGWQELVFHDHTDARRFAEKSGAELRGSPIEKHLFVGTDSNRCGFCGNARGTVVHGAPKVK